VSFSRRQSSFATANLLGASSLLLALSAIASPVAAETTAASAAASQPAQTTGADEVGLEEIVVTSRHREEKLQNVPIGITALTAQQLGANAGQLDLKEIEAQIPSLQLEGYSGRNQTTTIRGLGTNAGSTNDALEQGVGIYIDGVYFARTGTSIVDLPNIESLNVLRGPQGTLFGKNTVAGAIDIQTKEASFTPGGYGQVEYGNYGFLNVRGSVTGPISDVLAAQIVLDKTYRDGFVYNTIYHKDWDNRDDKSIAAELVYKPGDEFKYRLKFDYDFQRCDCGFLTITQILPRLTPTSLGFYQRAAVVGYTPIPITPFSRQTDINSSQYDRMPSGGLTGRGDWDVGWATLTSITGFRKYEWQANFDADYSGADVFREGIVDTHQQQASQEFRITSPSGEDFEYTGGLYYWWQQDDDLQVTTFGSQAAQWLTGSKAISPAILTNLSGQAQVVPITNSYSAYGQATWHVTAELSLTGGVRYTVEDKSGYYDPFVAGNYAPVSQLPAGQQALAAALRSAYAPVVPAYTVTTSNAAPSGTANISYKFTPDILGYATYSHGFKSAGLNLVNPTPGIDKIVKPEEVDDYELGVNASAFNRRLTLRGDLFWTIDDNFQANILTQNNLGRYVGYIGSVPEVRSRGAELDATAAPIAGLTTTFSAVFEDAEYVSYPNSTCPFLRSAKPYCDLSGSSLSGSPRWSLSASAEYVYGLDAAGLPGADGYVGGDWHYQSHVFSAVDDDPFTLIRGYHIFGLHAGVRSDEGGWNLSVWVRNLFDANYYNTLSLATSTGAVVGVYGEPRTYGVTLRKSF
jgi:iron complex outermembrane receptor protein